MTQPKKKKIERVDKYTSANSMSKAEWYMIAYCSTIEAQMHIQLLHPPNPVSKPGQTKQ